MLPNKPLIVGWVVTFHSIRATLHLIPIVGGNVDISNGGPIAPTICYEALFELGVLDVRPRSIGGRNVRNVHKISLCGVLLLFFFVIGYHVSIQMGRRGCLGLGFFLLLLGSYFYHCFFGLPLLLRLADSFFLLRLAAFSFFFSLRLAGSGPLFIGIVSHMKIVVFGVRTPEFKSCDVAANERCGPVDREKKIIPTFLPVPIISHH